MLPERRDDDKETKTLRVLVVDDDALVGVAIGRTLKAFQVTFAQSAAGALARIQAGGSFHAIVCDLFMPGMTGFQFYEELSKTDLRLAQSIIFMTGFSSSLEVKNFARRTGTRCIGKPFDPQALRAAVEAGSIEG